MTYLFFGNDEERINIYLKSFIDKFFSGKEKNIISFNARNSLLNDAISECYQIDLACNKKIVVIDDAYYLQKESKFSKSKVSKITKNNDYNKALNYIKEDCDENVILIFIVKSNEIDLNNVIVNAITKENKKFLSPIKDNDWPLYIKTYFDKKNLKIEPEAISELISCCQGNLRTFLNESSKLCLYCKNIITIDDIKQIVIRPQEDDIYVLTKYLIADNKMKALSTFRDLRLTQNIEPIVLITMMTNSLIFIDAVNYLNKNGYNSNEIATKLNVKPGKIYYALQDIKKLKTENIPKILEKLYQLDKDIKHNEIDRFYNFELFILNF